MPKLKDNKLTAKQQSFVNCYTDSSNKQTYNNGQESAKEAGYKGNNKTLSVIANQNLDKLYIKQAIDKINTDKQAQVSYNYETAIKELNQVITNLTKHAEKGNISANAALTQVIREKNAITGLHKQTIKHDGAGIPQLDDSEKAALSPMVRDFKLKLANTG